VVAEDAAGYIITRPKLESPAIVARNTAAISPEDVDMNLTIFRSSSHFGKGSVYAGGAAESGWESADLLGVAARGSASNNLTVSSQENILRLYMGTLGSN
jgi:hypothetical protein